MMKKKTTILLVTLLLFIGITTGCSDEQEELAAMKAETQQDTVEVIGIAQIEEELGIKILLPATISDENCSIIEGRLGVISFVLDGATYTYYVESAEEEIDATGMAADLPNAETILVDNNTYQMAYEKNGVGISYWYDGNHEVACTLLLAEGATADALKLATESILAVQI